MAQFSEIFSCERQGPAYITVITMAADDLTTQKPRNVERWIDLVFIIW